MLVRLAQWQGIRLRRGRPLLGLQCDARCVACALESRTKMLADLGDDAWLFDLWRLSEREPRHQRRDRRRFPATPAGGRRGALRDGNRSGVIPATPLRGLHDVRLIVLAIASARTKTTYRDASAATVRRDFFGFADEPKRFQYACFGVRSGTQGDPGGARYWGAKGVPAIVGRVRDEVP